MAKVLVLCPHCGGTGKVEHECDRYDLKLVKEIYPNRRGSPYSYESCAIYRCRACGQLWKIRWQYDDGTGSDNIWLKPGVSERGYEFTLEEAAEAEGVSGECVIAEKK